MSTFKPSISYTKAIQDKLSLKKPLDEQIPWEKVGFYILAFLIPILIMTIVYICIGIYPFGEKSLLTIDLYHQYIDFFSYYRQRLLAFTPQNFLYSFSKSMGGNIIGLFAYYLASPFNLIFLFFKSNALTEATLVLTLVKIGCCGITFAIMCRKMLGQRNLFTLIFSTCYALMAYNIVFQQNIMWIDGAIWLPIIALGIYYIVEKNSFIVYSASLAIALLSNYYIGYMLCIFSILFFIFSMITMPALNLNGKQVRIKIFKFIIGSMFAGGIAAALLLPTFMSLRNGKANFDPSMFSLNANFDFSQLLQKLFIGEMNIDLLHQGLETTLPDVFCGTMITILCFLYFLNRKITIKEKILSIIMLLILFMSLHIKAFDLIWHGFNTPVGFLYRNSFIISFFAIFLGVRCFMNLNGIKKHDIITCIGIFVAIAIYTNKFSLETLTAFEIYLTIIFFMIYGLILMVIRSGKRSALIFTSLMLIISVEFEISGFLTLEDLSHVNRETYIDNITSTGNAMTRLKKIDNSVYRVDKTFMRSRNDGMFHGYKTITHSSSTADYNVVKFLNKMGYRNESNIGNSYDYGSTLPADSLLNIKYIMTDTNEIFKYYVSNGNSDDIKILKNPYALPLMFKANKSVLNVQDNNDVFTLQNNLYASLSGVYNVLSSVNDIEVTMENLTKSSSDKNVNYIKNDEDSPAYIEYTFNAINDEEIYAHFPTEPIGDSAVTVYVNGKKIRDHLDSDHLTYYDVLRLGAFKAGETVNLRLTLNENETNFENFYIYALNKQNFEYAYDKLADDPIDFELVSQNHIVANVKNVTSNQLVFTTIPYDKGWTVLLDGKKVKPSVVLDTLMAIEVGTGNHTLELKYSPVGLQTGFIISGASTILLIIVAIYARRKKSKSIKLSRNRLKK